MQKIRVGCIPVRKTISIDTKAIRIKKIIKNNKIGLIVGGISIILLLTYAILLINFINLIKIMYCF